jgi:hypothetical protein
MLITGVSPVHDIVQFAAKPIRLHTEKCLLSSCLWPRNGQQQPMKNPCKPTHLRQTQFISIFDSDDTRAIIIGGVRRRRYDLRVTHCGGCA